MMRLLRRQGVFGHGYTTRAEGALDRGAFSAAPFPRDEDNAIGAWIDGWMGGCVGGQMDE